jgi:hypothetical protein
LARTLSPIFFSASAHWPSSAESVSVRSMNCGFFHEAPRAFLMASAPSLRLPKKACHSASTEPGSAS